MAGLALALELIDSCTNAASVAAVAAAAAGWTFVSPVQFVRTGIAHCDAGTADADANDDFFNTRWIPTGPSFAQYSGKTYVLEVKPFFSAFQPKALASTTLRALIVSFAPLLEKSVQQDDDEGGITDSAEVSTALKRSGFYALREIAVVTVRRILERVVVHYISARIAWKLLKDAPKSAARKAARNLSNFELFVCVSKTAFRAHALGVGANWIVQEAMEAYRGGKIIYLHRQNPNRPKNNDRELEVLATFGKNTAANTFKATTSLSLAAVGAGCGAVFLSPSTGTWIGLTLGDFAGAFLAGYCIECWMS